MSFDGLGDTPIPVVQLHGAFDLECRRVGRISGNTDQNQPFLIKSGTIVYYLSTGKRWMTIKNLLGRRRLIRD